MTVIGISIVEIMMFIRYVVPMSRSKAALSSTPRIKAIYDSNKSVIACIGTLLIVSIIVNAWLLTVGEGEQHHPIPI
jgi:hypothetical protein